MRRRNVTLPDDLDEWLEAEATRLGVSGSELVREAVVLRLTVASAIEAGARGDVLSSILEQLERIERARDYTVHDIKPPT